MAFVKHKLSCPSCGGSDPVSLNEDGSAKCFSCETYFINYEQALNGQEMNQKKETPPVRERRRKRKEER